MKIHPVTNKKPITFNSSKYFRSNLPKYYSIDNFFSRSKCFKRACQTFFFVNELTPFYQIDEEKPLISKRQTKAPPIYLYYTIFLKQPKQISFFSYRTKNIYLVRAFSVMYHFFSETKKKVHSYKTGATS